MIVKTYRPASPTCEAFHRCDAPVRCLVGAVGTAKTTTALWDIGLIRPRHIYRAWGIPHTRWFVVRRAYTWLMDTDFEAAMDWFLHGTYRASMREYTVVWPRMGDQPELVVDLDFRAAETDDDEKKFRSTAATGAWIDESIEIRPVIKSVIISRLGRYPKRADTPTGFTPRYLVETTNPCPTDHPMYWQYRWVAPKTLRAPALDEHGTPKWETGAYDTSVLVPHMPDGPAPPRPPQRGFVGFWQEPGENAANLRAGYWEDIKQLYPDSPEMLELLVAGKPGYRPEGRSVYRNYRQVEHMAKQALPWRTRRTLHGTDEGVPLIMGWDNTGLHPAAVLVQMVAAMQYEVLREFWDDRAGIIDFTRIVIGQLAVEFPGANITHYADPAGFSMMSSPRGGVTSPAQMVFEELGLVLHPSRQELHLRIGAVDDLLLRRGGLLIDPRCTRLLAGFFGGYVLEERPNMGIGVFKNHPKENNFEHVHDALQYAVVPSVYPAVTDKRGDIEGLERWRERNAYATISAGSTRDEFDPRVPGGRR